MRIDFPSDSSASEEFIFDPWGRHTSSHAVVGGWGWANWIYWGDSGTRVAVDIDSQAYFDHPDWEGTERMFSETRYVQHAAEMFQLERTNEQMQSILRKIAPAGRLLLLRASDETNIEDHPNCCSVAH